VRTLLAALLASVVHVPSGYTVTTVATRLVHPTAIAFGPDRRMYVAEDVGRVVRVVRGRPVTFAAGLRVPLGLLWRGRTLYVSQSGRVDALYANGRRRNVLRGLPFGRHQQNAIVAGPNGRLYLGSGSTCDACRERDRRSATILSFRPDGSGLRVEARGLRNPYGLVFRGRDLYATVNGQDRLGAWEPAESVVLVRRGRDFGWPRCHPSWRHRRLEGACRGVTPPVAYLEPHSSADGIAVWRGALYVSTWGEYLHRTHGRYLVRIRKGRVTRFATGFEHPLALAVDPSGGLLVADWGRGAVYRIARTR
jgi:glucose/arabinose dehydrogenase